MDIDVGGGLEAEDLADRVEELEGAMKFGPERRNSAIHPSSKAFGAEVTGVCSTA